MSYKEKPQLKLFQFTNNAFQLIAIIDDYQSCSFERNMYEAGQFTITINLNIPNAVKFERGLFVQFDTEGYDFGEIINISDALGEGGKGSQTRQITGYDARYIFKKRIIRNFNTSADWEMTDKGEIVMRNLIADQCGVNAEAKRQLPVINTIPTTENAIGSNYACAESYSNLYEILTTIATQTGCGWRLKLTDGELVLEFYEGEDLSSIVKFSSEFESIRNGNVSDSSDSYANTIYVGGKGSGDDRDVYEGELQDSDGNTPTGLNRYEAWDDESDLTTESEYMAQAESMLKQYGETVDVSANGLAKSLYEYKENYNVGDIIEVEINNISANVRILAVTENWSKGSYGLDFTIGKPLNTLGKQLNLMLTQIRKASNQTSSTDSVMWYTIPTDTEMAKADVTYNTIGFKGECASGGSTFKLYLDEEKTGAKTYHVYLKQLGGGTLTLTTGKSGAQNLTISSGTYVLIIYIDENGNISSTTSSHASTSESAVTAGTASTTTTETAETETGNNEVAINIDGFTEDDFVAGKTIKILVPQLDTGSPTLNINNLGAKPIKAVRDGQLIDIIAHNGFWSGATRSSDNTQRVTRVWDNNTTLELIYDGTNWVVVGNPLLNSYYSTTVSYRVYADGYIEQWGRHDTGSENRSINYDEIFPVQYNNYTTFTINISSQSSKSNNATSMCYGARDIHSYGIRIHIYGLNSDDTSRYALWQANGY